MEEENGVVTPEVTEEEVDLNSTEGGEAEEVEESVEEVKARLAKAEELANNYKIRAEKAEKAAKKPKETETVAENKDLSFKDGLAIMKANVPEEDIDEVVNYAKFKGISVTQALKDDVMKATLSLKSEQRNVAEATNTSSARRGSAKVSKQALIDNAKKGILPESDEDISRLLEAQMGYK